MSRRQFRHISTLLAAPLAPAHAAMDFTPGEALTARGAVATMAQRQPPAYRDLYQASRCTRGSHGEPCANTPYDVSTGGRRNCPVCMRVRSALEQRLLHDRALEVAVYGFGPTLSDLPADTRWTPRMPSQVPPLPPPPPPMHAARVKAYLRTEQGQVRQGVSAPTGVPNQMSHAGSLPPPPLPPGVAGARTTVVVSPVPISPASGGYAPARRVITTPPPPPASGSYAPARGSGGSVPSHASASGSFAPASGPKIHGVQPPLPFGPPPAKVRSVTNVVVNRRSFASASTRTAVDQFSRILTPEMGSAPVMTLDTASRSEIASNVHDNLPAPAAEDTVESNLSAYLQAACSGDERPVGSHPVRLATELVSGALEDIEREYESADLACPVTPGGADEQGGLTELAKRWRDFVIYLAVLVASVFDPIRFDACLREICAFNDDGSPDENCWRRALNYVYHIDSRSLSAHLLHRAPS